MDTERGVRMGHGAGSDMLGESELFRDVPAETLKDILALGFPVTATQDESIFYQGDEADILYVILTGHMRATQTTAGGDQLIIRYLTRGEVVGYAVLSGDCQHTVTLTAVKDSQLFAWPRSVIRQLLAEHATISMNALNVLGRRYREMQQRLREFSTESVEQRIARTVLRLIRQAGRRTAAGIQISFPLSRQDLAEMTGTTLHTVSRTFSVWESRGFVASGRRKVIVRDPYQLAIIAGEDPSHFRDSLPLMET
jgi:CRP-like cAMP-binding protein